MKRGIFLGYAILLLIFVVPFVFSQEGVTGEVVSGEVITGEVLTGETITGEATTQQVNLQIYVQLVLPYLYLRSPGNYTYRNNESILINYTTQNEDFVWYNLNNGQNISLSGATYIGIPEGIYTLYLFANNSNGLKRSQAYFTSNNSRIIIIYDEFKGVYKGDSSNFDNYTYEELDLVGDVVLENTLYGKIVFREYIDFLQGLSVGESIVNLDENIGVSSNLISLNSNNIPGLNKSATLYLYNISFDNPRILKDGEVCPVSLCQIQSYDGSTLVFNVNSFSSYSAEETPEGGTVIIDSGSGSSGGSSEGGDSLYLGPSQEPEEIFSISEEQINVFLKQGGTKEETFEITNNGNETLYFAINGVKTEKFLKISNRTFELAPGERIEIILDFFAKENLAPDLYVGKLLIETLGQEKEILVVMEVESKKSLFDVKLDIDRRSREIHRGGEIVAKIELFNLGEIKKADVVLEYIIKDSEGNELYKEHEMVAIETRASFIKDFSIPYSLGEGDYALYLRVLYGDEVASASSWFVIKEKRDVPWPRISLYFLLFFILFAIIRLYKLYIKEERKERVKKYEEEEKREEKRKKLEKKKESEGKYIEIKRPKPSKKKVAKKKINRKLTPSGYLDLTKALKESK